MKWLETAILHEANVDGAGDGGGSSPDTTTISEGVEGGAGDAAPSSEISDSSPSPEPRTSAPAAKPATKEPIAFPNALADIFTPRQPASPTGPPSTHTAPADPASRPEVTTPAAGPSKPDRRLAVTDPEAYAEQLEAYFEAKLESVQSTAKTPVEELRKEMQSERERQWSAAFTSAQRTAQTSLPRHWENILAKDDDFNANPELQGAVQDIIGYFVADKIKNGDIDGLHLAADPKFTRRALLIAKDELGIGRAPSYRPGGGPGLTGPQGHDTPKPSMLDEETRAAIAEADKEGYRYSEEQIAKALRRRNT